MKVRTYSNRWHDGEHRAATGYSECSTFAFAPDVEMDEI
jgi:hypothetical protein